MKHILIVDDEIDLAESVSTFLEAHNYKTTFCDNVEAALQKLHSQPIDLIISDIKMPKHDGVVFYENIKAEIKQKNIPFVLMTGHSEKVNMRAAYEMGVDEFVSKPFDMDDMRLVVNLLLQGNPDEDHAHQKFYKISLKEFLQTSANNYDIFLKINGNFLCLVKKGQELLPERLLNYYRKGMESIYLTAIDFARYIDMQVDISNSVKNKPLQKVKKIQLFNHFCKTLAESALQQNIDKDLYEKAYSSFENYTQVSFDNGDLYNLINLLKNSNKEASSRSVLVSFLAVVIFQQWGWTSPRQLSRISLAALLCDVGLGDDLGLAEKHISDLTAEEMKLYEKHPLQSYMLLSKIKNIPQEILYVAVQHHENEIGLGFPHRLSKLKLHPYARVIHALSTFVERVEGINSKASVKECLDTLLGFEQKLISQQVLKTLYMIFDIPVPKELNKTLLPTDTSRLT